MHFANAGSAAPPSAETSIGVILEKREPQHRWAEPEWHAVAVIPGGGPEAAGQVVGRGPGWVRVYAGRRPFVLHRSGTGGYREALAAASPQLYVVVRAGEGEGEDAADPFLVTACPYEAQDYLDSGEETVDGVPMPPEIAAWVQAFVDRHHVDTPFVKRKQKPKTGEGSGRDGRRR